MSDDVWIWGVGIICAAKHLSFLIWSVEPEIETVGCAAGAIDNAHRCVRVGGQIDENRPLCKRIRIRNEQCIISVEAGLRNRANPYAEEVVGVKDVELVSTGNWCEKVEPML